MPHHMNNITHSHDSDPRPCTTVPLSPCVNNLDSSPLGPVSFSLFLLLLHTSFLSSFPPLLSLLCHSSLLDYLSYPLFFPSKILIAVIGHVRNAHVP